MVRSSDGGGVRHTLPDNPQWLDFTRSDADPSRHPTDTTPVVRGGEVNFYREYHEEESLAIKWRKTVAKALALKLGYEGEWDSASGPQVRG